MLEGKYFVEDDNWKRYPTALDVKKLLITSESFSFGQALEIDSLIKKLVSINLRKESRLPVFLGNFWNNPEMEKMHQLHKLTQALIDSVQQAFQLTFDQHIPQKHLWLLDALGRPILSGFFDALLIYQEQPVGLILQHDLDKKSPIPVKEDLHLATLALIASEAFGLKEIVVSSIWDFPYDFDVATHNVSELQRLKKLILKRLMSHP